MFSLIPDHFKASTVGDLTASPDLIFLSQPMAKTFPTWQRHLKLSINQKQHLLKFMRVLFSLYSEDVQFADFFNVHPPPPKKAFSCPASHSSTIFGEPPPNISQFFHQFQVVHPFPLSNTNQE